MTNQSMKTHTMIATTLVVLATLTPFTAAAQETKPKGKAAAPFAAADKDGDKKLNLAEFTEMSKDRLDAAASKKRFVALDKDGDGLLTREEFRAGAKPREKKEGEKPAAPETEKTPD